MTGKTSFHWSQTTAIRQRHISRHTVWMNKRMPFTYYTEYIHGECVRALLFLCPYRDMWWTNERLNEWNDLYVNNNYNYNWKSMRTTFTAYYTLTYHIYGRFRSERMFKRRTTFFYILKEKFNWKRMSSYRRTIFKTKAENFQRKFTTTIWMTQIDCIFNTTL